MDKKGSDTTLCQLRGIRGAGAQDKLLYLPTDCMKSIADSSGNTKLVKPKLERLKRRIDEVLPSILVYYLVVGNEGQ
jgi:hypothetical protein